MSRSYRTQKESIIAKRRIARHADGEIKLPRIIERSPRAGDIHPLSKRDLSNVLKKMPIEYVYGLSRIELRARDSKEIGQPFAKYRPSEKTIILFSLPLEWELPFLSVNIARTLAQFHADATFKKNSVVISWKDPMLMKLWFHFDVFVHELGHHYVEQYRYKNGSIRGRRHNEFVAELHSKRFRDGFFKRLGPKDE